MYLPPVVDNNDSHNASKKPDKKTEEIKDRSGIIKKVGIFIAVLILFGVFIKCILKYYSTRKHKPKNSRQERISKETLDNTNYNNEVNEENNDLTNTESNNIK